MNEHGLKRAVDRTLAALRKTGARLFYFKTVGGIYQHIGMPDYVGCANGRFFGLELKHPDGNTQLTPMQTRVRHYITYAGGAYIEARSVDEVSHSMAELLGSSGSGEVRANVT